MSDILTLGLMMVGYYALVRWVFPKMGIST